MMAGSAKHAVSAGGALKAGLEKDTEGASLWPHYPGIMVQGQHEEQRRMSGLSCAKSAIHSWTERERCEHARKRKCEKRGRCSCAAKITFAFLHKWKDVAPQVNWSFSFILSVSFWAIFVCLCFFMSPNSNAEKNWTVFNNALAEGNYLKHRLNSKMLHCTMNTPTIHQPPGDNVLSFVDFQWSKKHTLFKDPCPGKTMYPCYLLKSFNWKKYSMWPQLKFLNVAFPPQSMKSIYGT